jgi:hypothetical protein
LPKEIDEVILKAIKRDRDERFQDCSSFIEALKSFYQIAGATPDDLVVKIVLDEGEPEEKGSRLSVSRARSDGDFTVPTISHMGGSQVRQALKPKRLLAFLFATLVVTAGLIAGWVVFFNSNREARPGAEKKADVEVRRPLEEKIEAMEHDLQESPGKEELVEIEVIGLVPGASVHVDGSKVETNPFKLEKSKDPVAVAIHYEGEVVWEKSLTPVANERLHVDIPEKKHAAKARKKPSRKKKGAKEGGTKEEPPAPPEKKEQPEKKGKRKIFKDFPE